MSLVVCRRFFFVRQIWFFFPKIILSIDGDLMNLTDEFFPINLFENTPWKWSLSYDKYSLVILFYSVCTEVVISTKLKYKNIMADDEEYHMDEDSDVEDEEEEEEGSDGDAGYFPIEEPIIPPPVQSSTTTTTSQPSKSSKDQPGNKYSTGVNASNNYPQDNNFEYVGKCKPSFQLQFSIVFSLIPR